MAVTEQGLLAGLEGFAGELLDSGDEGYDEARSVHNGLVDKRPALIARCRGVADVRDAIAAARSQGLEISIRGGGHNVAGTAVTNGGVLIDLSAMQGIFVDPEAQTVTAQGGVLWGALNRETQLHGLAVNGGIVSSTGIAGYTLGGGLGWLMAKCGLAADNLLSAQVVTADGRVLTASEEQNADLFWALRGGGGNFGVVTSFTYRLHAVGPIIMGGVIAYPFAVAGDVLRFWREFTAGSSDDMLAHGVLIHAPDGSGTKLAAVSVCHVGEPEQAERDLAPLLSYGEPALVQLGPIPYPVMNTILDDIYPRGALNYWKSSFVDSASDELIDTLIKTFATCPSPISLIALEHFHGAVTRVPATATPFPHRDEGINLVITSVWQDPEETTANITWTRETYDALQPFVSDHRYVNYYDSDDTGEDPARLAFGPNYERLRKVKTAYDADNVFHLNTNIAPA
jgi:FAD/FMN-containing dehydrogenase